MSHTPDVRSADSPAAAASGRTAPLSAQFGADAGRPAARRVRRWPLIVMRCLVTAFLLLTLVQPVLAGMFITGDVDLLALHEVNSHTLTFLSWLMVVSAVLLWRPGRGPWWPMPVTVLIAFLVQTQSGFGYSRSLALHIPLGVALTAGATALVFWSFTPRGGRR
ncbi:hypothetical protein QCN29_19060 [Streptomyces sp. HNM0663]|uniref:Integral membrane protein n=1 Tax=Streptomyces chengmaiensis TaxID=3040919 RepID=A0ABT6HQ61_9ACTN|nr:hypothetical protein [Streptomyces chengmaiensis]MDH2390854.1 hypothetical protein [Streptomyces chengmaiensis]